MKPFHATLLAGLTAALLAAPLSGAAAHDRHFRHHHHGHNAVPAFILGLAAGAVASNAFRHHDYDPYPHVRYRHGVPRHSCAGLRGGEYDVCLSNGLRGTVYPAPSYRVLPRHRRSGVYYRHLDPWFPGPGVEIIGR